MLNKTTSCKGGGLGSPLVGVAGETTGFFSVVFSRCRAVIVYEFHTLYKDQLKVDHYINVKCKNHGTFRKNTQPSSESRAWQRVLSLDPQNTIHKRED